METATSLLLFQAWACPQFCMGTALSLVYDEDDWPSLPKTHAYFSGFLSERTINRCFCQEMLQRTRVLRILKGFSQGNYETSIIALVAQLSYVDVTALRRQYKQLGYNDQRIAQQWTRYAMYGNCIQESFDSVCPP